MAEEPIEPGFDDTELDATIPDTPRVRLITIAIGCVITAIPLAWAIDFTLILGFEFFREQALAVVLGLAFAIIFLKHPASGGSSRTGPVPWYDMVLAVLGLGASLYLAYRYQELVNDFYFLRDESFAISVIIIPLIVEGLRRTAGWSLVGVLSVFLAYGFVGHLMPGKLEGKKQAANSLIAYLGVDNVALMGLPMVIVCMVVVLFIFMGRLLVVSGASNWFTDLAAALMGRSRGGSAKIAVVASGLFGSISGSAVSNVASTGVITIPLMRRAGYSAASAGAIEAVASTGGQIMPPIMGAAAFLMAELLEVTYAEVILAAVIPAILYYIAVFIQADLEAARLNIAPLPEDRIPPLLRVLKEGWFFTIPFIVLIVTLFSLNFPPEKAAFYAAVSIPIVSVIFGYKGYRMTPRELGVAIAESGRASVDIIMIGAMAGLIIGILEVTGLGFALTLVLTEIGKDSLFLLLVITAGVSILLGMGMPTSAIYFLLAVMVAQPLIQLGLDPMAAHLFVLYFGLMSMITPPVAIAAFTAAKLAGAPPMKTAMTAVRLGWVAYVMPFVFVLSPALIMRGTVIEVTVAVIAAVFGIWLGSAGMLGYFTKRLGPMMRALFLASGLALLFPIDIVDNGFVIRIAGALLGAVLIGRELMHKRRAAASASPAE